MPVIEIKKHQTLVDFVLQNAGSVAALFDVALANNLSVTDQPVSGTALNYITADQKTSAFFSNRLLDVVTIDLPVDLTPGGIGYMRIQNNFIVY